MFSCLLQLLTCIQGRSTVTPTEIPDICGKFVVIDEQFSRFSFVHSSAQEYLESRPEFHASAIHTLVFRRCMTQYVLDQESHLGSESDDYSPDATTPRLESLQSYVALYWPFHYTRIVGDNELAEACPLLLRFALDKKTGSFELWLKDLTRFLHHLRKWEEIRLQLDSVLTSSPNPQIALPCTFGFDELLEKALGRLKGSATVQAMEELNHNGTAPVYLSARWGNIGSLKHLLGYGASADPQGGHFGNPLQAALF